MNHELLKILTELRKILAEIQGMRHNFSSFVTNQRLFNTTHVHPTSGSPALAIPTIDLNMQEISNSLTGMILDFNNISNNLIKIERELRRNIERLVSQEKINKENIKILSNVKGS